MDFIGMMLANYRRPGVDRGSDPLIDVSPQPPHAEDSMKNLLTSLKTGNWRSLVACFLYFDTGFTVWVLYGPLAPFISKDITMTAAQQGFLVAVPVLAAAILRVTLGNLYQSADGRRVALLGVALSSIPTIVLPLLS